MVLQIIKIVDEKVSYHIRLKYKKFGIFTFYTYCYSRDWHPDKPLCATSFETYIPFNPNGTSFVDYETALLASEDWLEWLDMSFEKGEIIVFEKNLNDTYEI